MALHGQICNKIENKQAYFTSGGFEVAGVNGCPGFVLTTLKEYWLSHNKIFK